MTNNVNWTDEFENTNVRHGSAGQDKMSFRVVLPVGEISEFTWQTATQRVREAKNSFQQLGWQLEIVLLVKPEFEQEANDELADQVDEIVCGNLGEAFSGGLTRDVNRLAVVDLDISFNSIQWNWLMESGTGADVACCVHKVPLIGKWYSRLAAAASALIARFTLRSAKNDFRPGVVVFEAAKIRSLLAEETSFESSEELIACCRDDGQSVFEANLSLPAAGNKEAVTLRKATASISKNLRFWWNNLAFPVDAVKNPEQLTETPLSARSRWIASSILMAVAAFILFTNLGYPLFEPDESRNAQLALNICSSGDWMSLSLLGEPYWDKPPLQAWMTATSYRLFGPSEFSTRLPCAVASLLTLMTILLLGSKLYGFRTSFSAALLLLLCIGFSIVGRYVTMDASLTFFTTVMFLATILGIRNEQISPGWMVIAGIACGFGFLTKGPVIAVLVLPPILFAGWLEKKAFFTKRRFWLFAGVPAFLISAPWFLATAFVHPDFLVYFFWKHNVVRFSDAFNHQQPSWFYIPVIVLMMYPASFLLPSFVKMMFTQTRSQRRRLGNEFGKLVLYVAWIIGFFSLSDSKLPSYILPALPIFCLLLGRMLAISVFAARPAIDATMWQRELPLRVSKSVIVFFCLLACLLIFGFSVNDVGLIVVIGITLASSVLLYVFVCRRGSNLSLSWIAAAAIAVAFMALSVGQVLPKIAESRSVKRAISQLVETPKYEDSPIVFLGRPPYGCSFWLPEKEVLYFEDDCQIDAIEYLANRPQAIVVASNGDIETLEARLEYVVSVNKEELHRRLYTTQSKRVDDHRSVETQTLYPLLRISKRPYVVR